MHLFFIALALTVASSTPIGAPGHSPVIDMGKLIFKRQRDCNAIGCIGGNVPIAALICTRNNCGLCSVQGLCLPDPGDSDSYDPNNPGNPYGGDGGAAGNGDGSGDSSGTCAGGDVSDDAGSCPVDSNNTGAGGNTQNQAASCGGSCSTSDSNSCGSGCGCTFAGTGAFGGADGSCIALVSFGSG